MRKCDEEYAPKFSLAVELMNDMDRLSPLSDSVLHRIFSFLNIKSVIQTCVLSKRWKTLWIDTPTLNFDFDNYPFEISTGNGSNSKYSSIKRFVARVFSDHLCKSIQKLSYSSSINTDDAGLVVELLICYARQHQVREFCINTFDSVYSAWPLDLLECSSLTVLKMTCGFVDERKKLYFPWLRVLEIGYNYEDLVNIAESEDITMLWDCPRLESLVVVDCIFGSVTISAPKLESFEFSFPSLERDLSLAPIKLLTPKLKRVKLCNALPIVKSDSELSCIHEVNIVVDNFEFNGVGSATQNLIEKFFQLLRVFHNARSFTLPLEAIEVLLSSPPLSRFSFQNLRNLKLKLDATSYINSLRLPISSLMSLLNCPNLEMLEVGLNQRVNQYKCELERKLSLLSEENERRRQIGVQEDREREELRARIDELEAMAQQFLNQQEGSRGESQRRSQGDPST